MTLNEISMDLLKRDPHFVPLHEEELEFFVDLAVNESQRWIEAATRNKFRSPDFLESLEDGVLLCELLESVWPCYLRLDDGSDVVYTRLYGQYSLEAFRAAVQKIGIDGDLIFLPIHIHAPERYICSADAQDAIQEALIRVTVTVYLLGWRAKETPTYTGPQLDLSAFTQLYQHYLYHLHNNADTLCNQVNKTFEETTTLADRNRTHANVYTAQLNTDLGDEQAVRSVGVRETRSEMSGQMAFDHRNEIDDPLNLCSSKNVYDTELYRGVRSGYYADSVGSCDSACGSSSPSMAEPVSRGQRPMDTNRNSDEFVKIKHPTGHSPTSVIDSYMEVNRMKQRLKDDEAEWQLNLDSWKSKRKSNILSHDSDDNAEQKDDKRDLKTFPEMIERLKRQGGILASYLDDSINDENLVSPTGQENMPHSEEQFTSHHSDHSEKDSSSGISSPRSSRSLTSVSPPPSLAVKQLVSSLNAASAYQASSPVKSQPETTGALTSKRVVYLKPVDADAVNVHPSGLRQKNINNLMDQDKSVQLDMPKNPNIDTAIKPFGEKLAMFRSVQTEDIPVQIDLEKCSYKELVKPELSLKDKLSVFERPLDGLAANTRIDAQPQAVKVKNMRNVFETASAATTTATSAPSAPKNASSSGGISRLLSKDLQNFQQPTAVSSVPVPDFDAHLPEQYLQEINGILGGGSDNPIQQTTYHDDEHDFPPPPLPAVSPPAADLSDSGQEHETDLAFPSPPPPLEHLEPLPESKTTEDVAFRRVDSTRRIKNEISKRRSDFFGIKNEPTEIDLDEPEKARPKSLHEFNAATPEPVTEDIVKAVTFYPSNSTSLDSEPNGVPSDDEDIVASLPTKEALISKIVDEYHKEIEHEEFERVVKKEPVGILKNHKMITEATAATYDSKKEHTIPIELIPDITAHALQSENVIILDKVEKVIEETRITGSFETISREEMRSLDYMTVSGRAPVQIIVPPQIHYSEGPVLNGITPLHHYRDYSDGGYSSGRSDPGHAAKLPPVSIPPRSYTEMDAVARSSEFHPPRPPLPSEFKPPPFSGSIIENSGTGYVPQYVPHTTSVSPPARMQPKAETAQRKPLPNPNVQQHWVVQEAEMRRISEQEARMRQPVNPVPVPTQVHKPVNPAALNYSEVTQQRIPLREMPVNYQRRVVELGVNHDGAQKQYIQQLPTRTSTIIPVAVEQKRPPPRSHPQPSVTIGISATVPPRYPEVHYPQKGTASSQAGSVHVKQHSPTNQHYLSHPYYPPPSVAGSQVSLSQPKLHYSPVGGREYPANVNAGGISSKRRCAHCNEALGRGAAMIVENLQLYYHVACFKCYVCGQMLGNGREGTDVRVRNTKLHCALCYSDEEGLQLSQL